MNWGITCQSPPCKTLFLYTCHTEIKAHTSILSLMYLRASAVPWKSSSSGMVTKSNFSFGLQRLVKIWWNCVSAESSTIIMISGKKINTWTCYCCWSYEQPNLNEGPQNVEGHSLAARPIRSTTQIWVVTHHQYGISLLIPQMSFCRENAKCWLFSEAKCNLQSATFIFFS